MKTWQDILKQVGYPTDILTLDFETFFSQDYSLEKMSTVEYINDPRFELGGLGWYQGGYSFFEGPSDTIDFIKQMDFNSRTIFVQNAKFDITILQEKFGIVPKYIIDLKDLAKHYDARMSHKLKDLCSMFGLPPKGDTMQFKGLHWKDMTEEQRKAYADYCINDVKRETDLVKILLPKLSNPEVEVQLMRHTLDLWLHKRFKFDRDLADSLKVQMMARIRKTVEETGIPFNLYDELRTKYAVHSPKWFEDSKDVTYIQTRLEQEAFELAETELRSQKFVKHLQAVLPAGETVPMKLGKRGNIPAIAQNDDGCKWLLAHPMSEVRNLMLARQAVKSWPLHIARIENMERQAEANGGLLRVPLSYYSGHTGRWGGEEDINLQNFGGRGRSGAGIDPLISKMRELLQALDGHTLGIGDSAQIEARILAWLAGQEDLLKGFANGEDIYSEFATTLFRTIVRKPKKSDPKPVARLLDIRRGFGKDAILGCGFGMGDDKFFSRCLQNPSLRPLFDSGQYDRKFIERLITIYRTTYSKIPAYWGRVERAFRTVIRFPHLQVPVGKIEFSCCNNEVSIKLPSGRILYYRHCRIDKSGKIKYHWGTLWGGSITENIVQSIARDLLGYWILECEKAGLPVVLHAHDEVVTMLPKNHDQCELNRLSYIMSNTPVWAEGLPVGAEVKESDVYTK